MLLHIHPVNPQQRLVQQLADGLAKGAVIIYPTDTVYGLGCDIFQHKAVERICRIKNVDPKKAQLSFICYDLSDLSKYTKSISTPLYRMLKSYLPGPYTFILPASKEVPKMLQGKKDTIGLRIPDNEIARSIIRTLGRPLLSASIPGVTAEELADPEVMYDKFQSQVEYVVEGGVGGIIPSTIIDCTGPEPEVIREGLGEWRG